MSKYAAGVYSTDPADWTTSRWRKLGTLPAQYGFANEFTGEAIIDSFTIQPGKGGETGTIVARCGHLRICANSSNPAALASLRNQRAQGRKARIEYAGEGVNQFWLV